ncbi:MAG: Glu/Leu/Phe/Val dehydrogenase dimerization domain-containing protein [Candidatus Micrarchaeia archaeon]
MRGLESTVPYYQKVHSFWAEKPLKVIAWQDALTEAKGWLVINKQINGAAGGGIRMKPGVTAAEVTELAKDMSLKFTLLNPCIGGAKAGIDYDPSKADKQGVLQRFVEHIQPELLCGYGTGGDLNISESELISALAVVGISHPQYGIVAGVKKSGYPVDEKNAIARLRRGVVLPHDGSTLVELSTGKGVIETVKAALEYTFGTGSFKGKTATIQGFGVVGGGAAKYFSEGGGTVIAISDEKGMIYCEDGLDISRLLKNRINGRIVNRTDLPSNYSLGDREKLLGVQADVLIPAAQSYAITDRNASTISARIISEGANSPTTPAAKEIINKKGILVIPDFIANAGVACLFHECMFYDAPLKGDLLLSRISTAIGNKTRRLLKARDSSSEKDFRLLAQADAIETMEKWTRLKAGSFDEKSV